MPRREARQRDEVPALANGLRARYAGLGSEAAGQPERDGLRVVAAARRTTAVLVSRRNAAAAHVRRYTVRISGCLSSVAPVRIDVIVGAQFLRLRTTRRPSRPAVIATISHPLRRVPTRSRWAHSPTSRSPKTSVAAHSPMGSSPWASPGRSVTASTGWSSAHRCPSRPPGCCWRSAWAGFPCGCGGGEARPEGPSTLQVAHRQCRPRGVAQTGANAQAAVGAAMVGVHRVQRCIERARPHLPEHRQHIGGRVAGLRVAAAGGGWR